VVLPRTCKVVLEKFPAHTLQEGDVLCTNDPWIGTGHLPDYVVLTPVFHKGKMVAFMGTVAHLSDVGGHRGDIEAYDNYTEGIRIPPTKLYHAGQENQLLFEIIGNNCRVPEMVLGDLRAIVGTHYLGARRLREFLNDYEMADIVALSDEIHNRSEVLMRERIEALPDGVYEFGLDIDGYIETVHLHAKVEIRGSDIYVDYSGTSPQTRLGAINCVYNTTYASTLYPFKCALAPRIPNNEGLFRPVHVTAPKGCILNCSHPFPVQARAKVTNNINQVLFGAVWPILGEQAQAGSGSIWPFSVSGQLPGYGAFSAHMLPHRLSPQQFGDADRDHGNPCPHHVALQGVPARFGGGGAAARRDQPADCFHQHLRYPDQRPAASGQNVLRSTRSQRRQPGPGRRGAFQRRVAHALPAAGTQTRRRD
jgi:N-methylhydantoinase B/oxoprolinase/acetone carboxylase alpha subunit